MLPPGPAERELQLPVWNALYQVRDFAQYVNWIRAKDRAGKPLAIRNSTRAAGELQGACQRMQSLNIKSISTLPAHSERNSTRIMPF